MHQSGWTYALVLGGLAVIVFVLWLIGKIFPSKTNTAAGNALIRAEVFLNPSREHVIEAREHEEKEDEDSGDPPVTGV
jgi:hypothetical protein